MPTGLDRDEQVAQFYVRHADRLRDAISAKTRGLDSMLVEDACAFAWEKLLCRPDIDLARWEAYWWVHKVALRQAWALGRALRREEPAGGLSGTDDESPEPLGTDADLADIVADRVECAVVREVLGELHWRERRELLLYAHGLSWQEIATVTGTSYTAVNRWLARGKKALREARARKASHGSRRPR